MRSGLPGGPIVEHVGNAPSPLMGIGAALMFVGLFLTMALSAAENNQVLTYIGIGGVITMIVGIAFIGIGYALLERRWKKEDEQ